MKPLIHARVSRAAISKTYTILRAPVRKNIVPSASRLCRKRFEPPLTSRAQCSSSRSSSIRKRSVAKGAASTRAILYSTVIFWPTVAITLRASWITSIARVMRSRDSRKKPSSASPIPLENALPDTASRARSAAACATCGSSRRSSSSAWRVLAPRSPAIIARARVAQAVDLVQDHEAGFLDAADGGHVLAPERAVHRRDGAFGGYHEDDRGGVGHAMKRQLRLGGERVEARGVEEGHAGGEQRMGEIDDRVAPARHRGAVHLLELRERFARVGERLGLAGIERHLVPLPERRVILP